MVHGTDIGHWLDAGSAFEVGRRQKRNAALVKGDELDQSRGSTARNPNGAADTERMKLHP